MVLMELVLNLMSYKGTLTLAVQFFNFPMSGSTWSSMAPGMALYSE